MPRVSFASFPAASWAVACVLLGGCPPKETDDDGPDVPGSTVALPAAPQLEQVSVPARLVPFASSSKRMVSGSGTATTLDAAGFRIAPTANSAAFSSLGALPPSATKDLAAPLTGEQSVASSPFAAALSKSIPAGGLALVGSGYNSLLAQVRAHCIEPDGLTTVGSTTGQSVTYYMEQIDSVQQLESSLNISASASFKFGIFSGDLAASYSNSSTINSFSTYVAIRTLVVNQTLSLPHYRMQQWVLDRFPNGIKNREFVDACGDNFVAGVQSGGEFLAIIEISSNSREEQQAAKVNVQAAVTAWNAKANVAVAMQSMSKLSRTAVKILRNGDSGGAVPAGVEGALQYSLDFPGKVSGQGAWPTALLIMDYGVAENLNVVDPITFEAQQLVLEELAAARTVATMKLNDALFVLGHLGQFFTPPDPKRPVDSDAVQAVMNAATKQINDINAAARKCASTPDACALPQLEAIPAIDKLVARVTNHQDSCIASGTVEACTNAAHCPGKRTCGDDGLWTQCLPSVPCGCDPSKDAQQECRCANGFPGWKACVEGNWAACDCSRAECAPGTAEQCQCDQGNGILCNRSATCTADGHHGVCPCGDCVCAPGSESSCTCPGSNCGGTRRCLDSGSDYTACSCFRACPDGYAGNASGCDGSIDDGTEIGWSCRSHGSRSLVGVIRQPADCNNGSCSLHFRLVDNRHDGCSQSGDDISLVLSPRPLSPEELRGEAKNIDGIARYTAGDIRAGAEWDFQGGSEIYAYKWNDACYASWGSNAGCGRDMVDKAWRVHRTDTCRY